MKKRKPNLYNLCNNKTRIVIAFIENKENPYDWVSDKKKYNKFEARRRRALRQKTPDNMLNEFRYMVG